MREREQGIGNGICGVYNEMKYRVERKIELERAMIPPALLGESLLASNCDRRI